MFARLTLLEIDTVRTSVASALETFRTHTLPELKAQPGYRGMYALTTHGGKSVLLSFWDTEEQARSDDRNEFYGRQLHDFATLFASPPGRESYEVAVVDQPRAVADRQ